MNASLTSAGASLADRILEVASRSDTRPFLRLLSAEGVATELPYLGLVQQAAIWVRIYKKYGLKPRQRVVILLHHSVDSYAAFLGALISALVPAMLPPPSPKLSANRFRDVIQALLPTTKPDAVVIGGDLRSAFDKTPNLILIPTNETLIERPIENLTLESSGSGDDTAFLQYSSGTTGLRKGVAISHGACLRQVDLYGAAIGLGSTDSIVSWLPLYHDMGLIACWMLPLLTGTPVTAMSPFDWVARPSMLTQAVREYRPTLCWLPNFAFSHLARSVPDQDLASDDWASLRAVVNCSEPIRHTAHEAFLAKFARSGARPEQIATCYAMAETTFAITASQPGIPPVNLSVDPASLGPGSAVRPGQAVLVSSGKPIAGTTVRIVDDRGQTVPDGTVGYVLVKSRTLTAGYLGNAKATRAALVRGELHTGDLGFVAAGELFVLGRADDMIILAGRNIFPQDLEAVTESIPGVVPGRSVAFGVTDEGEGTSHIVVIAEIEAGGDRRDFEGRISVELVARLDVSPRAVRAVDRGWLRKSTSGKISRGLNRERYLTELAALPTTPVRRKPGAQDSLIDFVRASVAVALNRECPPDDASLIVSGQLDSLALTTLLLEFGERFGNRLPMPNVVGFRHFDSVNAILHLLTEVEGGFTSQSRQASYAARDVKLKALRSLSSNLDLLIVGSSTSFPLPCRVAEAMGLSAFNFSVNAASVADLYCLIRFVTERPSGIRRLVVGLDVFAFKAKGSGVLDLRTFAVPELTRYLISEDQAALVRLRDETSRESQGLRINLQRLAEWNPGLWYSFDERNGDLILGDLDARDDRSRHGPRMLDLDVGEIAMLYDEDFDRICPKQSAYLRSIVGFASDAGIAVDLVVMPLPPQVHAFLAARSIYPARRADIIELSASLVTATIRLHDLPTPAAFGGDDADFEDSYHVGSKNGALLLRHVLSR